MKSRILVAIPCFNCAFDLGKVLAGFDEELLDKVAEIVVIDNNSDDDSVAVAIDAAKWMAPAQIGIFRNRLNYGLGGTFKIAAGYAHEKGFDWLVFLHGDHQVHTRELIKPLELKDRYPEQSAFLGSRFMKGAALINYSKVRECGNRALNFLFSMMTKTEISDLGSGLTMYRLGAIPRENLELFEDGMAFDIDLLLYLLGRKEPILFFPIEWHQDGQKSNADNIPVGLNALVQLFRWRTGLLNTRKRKNRTYTVLYRNERLRR